MKTNITQSVAILCDGNNIERSIQTQTQTNSMLNFDVIIPRLLNGRGLNRLIYFREGRQISSKLADRLHENFFGSVVPCHKSADIPLSIKATQLASKVDTIIILSGDSDYVDLVRHLKSEGVRVEIAAVKENSARILLDEADYFHPITKNDWFEYTKQPRFIKPQKSFNAPRTDLDNQQKQYQPQNTQNTDFKQVDKKIEFDHIDIIKQKLEAQSTIKQEPVPTPISNTQVSKVEPQKTDVEKETKPSKKTAKKQATTKQPKKEDKTNSTKTTEKKETTKKKGLFGKMLKK